MSPDASPKSDPDAAWFARIKETMAVDIGRFTQAGLPPRAIVAKLFEIPEVQQAFRLRANRRRSLPIEPSTEVERQEVAEALERVAAWLDDGMHEALVAELREIAEEVRPPE